MLVYQRVDGNRWKPWYVAVDIVDGWEIDPKICYFLVSTQPFEGKQDEPVSHIAEVSWSQRQTDFFSE